MSQRSIVDCPFCEGDEWGCCFCDHSGKIYVGKGYVFEKVEDIKVTKESDLKALHERGAFDNLKGKAI